MSETKLLGAPLVPPPMSFSFPRGSQSVSNPFSRFKNLLRDEDGPAAVEYAVLLSVLVVACLTAISAIGT
jgi:Flp pilus assembly pilin Flp